MNVGSVGTQGMAGMMQELLKELQEELLEQEKRLLEEAGSLKQVEQLLDPAFLESLAAGTSMEDGQSFSDKAAALKNNGNLMSRNFMDDRRDPSRYLTSMLDTFQMDKEAQLTLQQRMSEFMGEMGGEATPGEGRPAYFDNMIKNRMKGKRAAEAFERNLEESREAIEKKAEEATAPKDAEGNPIPTDENGNPEFTPAEVKPVNTADLATAQGSATLPASNAGSPEAAALPQASAEASAGESTDVHVSVNIRI